MSHYLEQRQREWRRQNKRSGDQHFIPRQHTDTTILYPNMSTLSATNSWINQSPFMMANSSPPQRPANPILPYPTQPPETPPSSSSSFRRRSTGSQPISPPNPLRLASTRATRGLPRPDTSPYFVRSFPPPIYFEYIGHPSLRVFKVKLPSNLIDGPLDAIISAAEKHGTSLPDGWNTELYSLTKCDIACREIPGISEYVKPISKYISLAMQILYGCRNVTVDKNQPHILKYSAEDGYTGGKIDSIRLEFVFVCVPNSWSTRAVPLVIDNCNIK